jgi:multidrug efflux pump subunit AcrA (membrane-fusion protein)
MSANPTPLRPAAPAPVAHPDLEALRRTESAPAPRARRRWLPRLTAALLVVGVLAAAWVFAEPFLFPPRTVRMSPVIPVEGIVTHAGEVVQATGWIEAEPFPVTVRPLVRGVVERIEVLEGQPVTRDETVIAVLRNPELENASTVAAVRVKAAETQVALEEADLALQRALLEQRLDLRAEVARYGGEVRSATASAEAAEASVRAAEAALEEANLDLEAQRALQRGGAEPSLAHRTARQRQREAAAALEEKRAEQRRASSEVERLRALLALAEEGVEAPRDLEGRVRTQEARVARARADLAVAEAERDVARRNVELLTVRAPADGMVLQLLSAAGSMAGPVESMRALPGEAAGTESTATLDAMAGGVVSIYDPAHLQARVDVQFEDIASIAEDADVALEVPAVPGRTFRGRILRFQHTANILKNTLQVKIRILEPVPELRPEMRVSARFPTRSTPSRGSETVAALVRVPREAVRGDAVFVYDPRDGGRARRMPVQVVRAEGADVVVQGDLGLSRRVILDPVQDGDVVRSAP